MPEISPKCRLCFSHTHLADAAFSGILTSREGNTITVETPAGPVRFEASAASTVRLCDDEDLFH